MKNKMPILIFVVFAIFIVALVTFVSVRTIIGQGKEDASMGGGKSLNENINEAANAAYKEFNSNDLGISFSYPAGWDINYADNWDAYSFVLEVNSDETVTYSDPTSSQEMKEPVVSLSVYQNENFDNLSLGDWINENSNIEYEQTRIKKDKDGYAGVEQWVWLKGNSRKSSIVSYFIKRGSSIWEFSAWIDIEDQNSQEFLSAKEIVDNIFESIQYNTVEL